MISLINGGKHSAAHAIMQSWLCRC